MSIQAVSWALGLNIPDARAKLVLVCLANYADHKSGVCWPSIDTLCEESSQARSTVKAKLDWLAEEGFITIEHRTDPKTQRSTSNLYRLVIDQGGGAGARPLEGPAPGGGGAEPRPGEGPAGGPPLKMNHHLEPSTEPSRAGARATVGRSAGSKADLPPVEGVHAITVEPHTKQAAAWDRYHREKNYRPIDWTTGPKVFATEWPPVHVAHPTPAPKPPQLPPGDE